MIKASYQIDSNPDWDDPATWELTTEMSLQIREQIIRYSLEEVPELMEFALSVIEEERRMIPKIAQQKINKQMDEEAIKRGLDKLVGYWRLDKDIDSVLPWPEPQDTDFKEKEEFLSRLKVIEENSEEIHFKGFSICRICGTVNGSSEYTNTFTWPSGYSHYIAAHNVRPDCKFFEFVMGESACFQ